MVPSRPTKAPAASAPAIIDPTAAAWRLAVEGQLEEAYTRLRTLAERRTRDADLYARLYWLLVLHPALDAECDRRQWLATGLPATGFDRRLAELYDRELQGAKEVLRPRCRKVLECRRPLAPWARFTARSWEYAGLLGHWEIIAKDLEAAREEVAGADRTLWARLLLTAAEQFLWQDDPRAYDQLAHACRRELDEYAEEHWELSSELDRCDYLAELTAGRRQLAANATFLIGPDFIDDLCELLRRSWVQPFAVIQPELLRLLRPMTENLLKTLGDLDRVQRISPAVLHQFRGLVETLRRQRHDFEENPGGEQAVAATEAFLRKHDWGIYDRVRADVLIYCIGGRITLDDF